MNTVISGYGQGCKISNEGSVLSIKPNPKSERVIWKKTRTGNPVKKPVLSYEILHTSESTSTSSVVKRGIVGSLIGGTVGGIIGASTAKQNKSFTILVHWKDGKDSLIEIDDEYYKVFIKNMV